MIFNFWYLSECPKCGNFDLLTKMEIKEKVHCQECIHHYDYKEFDTID